MTEISGEITALDEGLPIDPKGFYPALYWS